MGWKKMVGRGVARWQLSFFLKVGNFKFEGNSCLVLHPPEKTHVASENRSLEKENTSIFRVQWIVLQGVPSRKQTLQWKNQPFVSMHFLLEYGDFPPSHLNLPGCTSLSVHLQKLLGMKKGAPASLGYIGDEILPSYTGIIIKLNKINKPL